MREKGDDMRHEKKEGEKYLTGKKAKARQKQHYCSGTPVNMKVF